MTKNTIFGLKDERFGLEMNLNSPGKKSVFCHEEAIGTIYFNVAAKIGK